MFAGWIPLKMRNLIHNNPCDKDRSTSCGGVQQVSQGCMMADVALELRETNFFLQAMPVFCLFLKTQK